jgi:hypothetical protein
MEMIDKTIREESPKHSPHSVKVELNKNIQTVLMHEACFVIFVILPLSSSRKYPKLLKSEERKEA